MSTIALKQAAELHRKLRMTARFILGSLQDQPNPVDIPGVELSLVSPLFRMATFTKPCQLDRYVLNELCALEGLAKSAYERYAFHEGEALYHIP